MEEHSQVPHSVTVNFPPPRPFGKIFKSSLKEALFPDDPFRQFKDETTRRRKTVKTLRYFFPILDWASKYSLRLFQYDVLAGITIACLAVPQGISYANLAKLPPIIGLYSSFIPPLIYAAFGSSKDLAVGTVAAASLLSASIIGSKVDVVKDPELYLHLFYTATFFVGIFQLALGLFRLGILVDFLSHSTILGFMGGTAIIICLQQLKPFFGLKKFTSKTDVVSVLRAIFSQTHEWRWESAAMGIVILIFLTFTQYIRRKKPQLFYVSAIAPMVAVIVSGVIAYLLGAEKHGIQIVGPLKKGLNPISIKYFNFDPKYISVTVQTGLITGMIALAEGIAVGRVFAGIKDYQTDGNKEMIAFGMMNLIGSCTSCYLTTGPFSKTAVNFNAGSKTPMSNVVMSVCLMFVLLFLAPFFAYTPLVALAAIIMSAMLGLIKYKQIYRLFKVDKFDFIICMAALLGVVFISMDMGIMISVGISVVRALLYVSRPGISKLGQMSDTMLYRDVEQYPESIEVPNVLVLDLGSPIYFANAGYMRERIGRYINEEIERSNIMTGNELQYLVLDLSGVSSIDKTGIEMLKEVNRIAEKQGIKMALINPRMELTEKFTASRFLDTIGHEWIFLSISEAVASCRFVIHESKKGKLTDDSETED
ncbi:probable sulfate transporter 3.5 [Aristolochia californica]|uniref:probable sulfate transporter 3.5 n=1 Tax=Aristolochia californica TaxID=171875 RepID=UPI0035E1BAE8